MNASRIEFRAANEADIDAISGLWLESSQYHKGIDFRLAVRNDAVEHVRVFYSKLFKDENTRFIVASAENALIGYICIQIQEQPPIHFEKTSGFVDGFYVKPDYRHLGVGTELYQRALKWLKDKNIQSIRLMVSPNNSMGLAFWREQDFSELMYLMHTQI
jgi:ribosomal protein S18 acetylase RimI-like enzyme